MAAAWDLGVNFFDNAEVYAAGESERIMGEVLKKLAWPRLKYVVSTKFFWGITDGPNEKNTLNRKYLMNAIDGVARSACSSTTSTSSTATAPTRRRPSRRRCGRCTT